MKIVFLSFLRYTGFIAAAGKTNQALSAEKSLQRKRGIYNETQICQ